MHRFLKSLRFQISAAFLALLALFSAACLTTLAAFQRQLDADAVVEIAARLELTSNQMHMQAMNYDAHAPRDYATYYRDVQLYYRDLSAQIDLFDAVVMGFMSGDFSTVLDRPAAWMKPASDPRLGDAVETLETAWTEHREGLVSALGDDTQEPRLEWAAEYNIEHLAPLESATATLAARLRDWAQVEQTRLRQIAFMLLGGTAGVAIALLAILHFLVLKPLHGTLAALRRSTDGDFGEQVTTVGATEIHDLAMGFNALSARLHLLFQLIERLQQGNDLDEVVQFLGRDCRDLLRFDWIGVVLITADGHSVRLEASALDGELEPGGKPQFPLAGTLLEQSLRRAEPMHIPDMRAQAAANPKYGFLRDIAGRGMADAVFLPVTTDASTPSVVAFASRSPNRYDDPHMRFLTNIAQLISASFARTVRLSERGRLAAIGEFASGIAHELRTPLATVSLAFERFERRSLSENDARRLALARAEAGRMQRLLEEMLLYAKPVQLSVEPVDLVELVRETLAQARANAACGGKETLMRVEPAQALVLGDGDRLRQILLNLIANACEAAASGSDVSISITSEDHHRVAVQIDNVGDPIDASSLERLFQPFVSTKPGGTGLGLAIARRLTALHGGGLQLSPLPHGTRATLSLPLAGSASPLWLRGDAD